MKILKKIFLLQTVEISVTVIGNLKLDGG